MLTTSRTRLRETMAGLSRKSWFPHVPISLAVALLGLLHLMPVIDQATRRSVCTFICEHPGAFDRIWLVSPCPAFPSYQLACSC